MGKYILIPHWDFKKYRVRRVSEKVKLILAYCQQDGDEWWCCNVIAQYNNLKNIPKLIRLCKEKNDDLAKKV